VVERLESEAACVFDGQRLPTQYCANTRDRLEMLRLSHGGRSIPKFANHLLKHHQTVRFWIKTFLLEGFDRSLWHTGNREHSL
jgi:hypothetical protein